MSDVTKLERRTCEELDKVSQLSSVYVLMKDGEIRGRITLRYTKNATHVAFLMYRNGEHEPICGYQHVTGWGFDRGAYGIGNVLVENKTALQAHGVKLDEGSWQVAFSWQNSFKNAGFLVIQAN